MDANLNARIATAVVGIPLLVWLIGWSPPWFFETFIFILTVGALDEYYAMTFPHAWLPRVAGNTFGVVLALAVMLSGESRRIEFVGAALVLAFSISLFFRGALTAKLNLRMRALFGGLYVGYLLPFVVLLFRQPEGRAWLGWLLFVIMAGDSAAYFIGRRIGERRLAPLLSPGKTVAGAWGYLLGAVLAGLIGAPWVFKQFSWLEILLLSLAVGVLGQVGDLFESWIKRLCAVKDAGRLLPGHGGLLDRLDSLIFAAVMTTIYLRIFHS